MSDEVVTGEIVRDADGKFSKGMRPANIITSANARTLAEKRWAKHRLEAASRVMREAASIDPTVTTPAAAWGVLVARTYQQIMDSDRPRGDDMIAVGKAMGAMPSDSDRARQDTRTPGSIMDDLDADILLIALRRRGGGGGGRGGGGGGGRVGTRVLAVFLLFLFVGGCLDFHAQQFCGNFGL